MGKKIMQSRNDEYHKLTRGERIGYGMGDFAQPGFRHNRRLSCSTYVDGEYDQYGHCGVHFSFRTNNQCVLGSDGWNLCRQKDVSRG